MIMHNSEYLQGIITIYVSAINISPELLISNLSALSPEVFMPVLASTL